MSFARTKSWVIENIILRMGDLMLRTDVVRQLKTQRQLAHLDEERLQALQREKLYRLLVHATTTCEAYRSYAHFVDDDPFEWLRKFPVIRKVDTNRSIHRFVSSTYAKGKLIEFQSSGSSGVRSHVFLDQKEISLTRAILLSWWEWNGYYLGRPMLQTGMSPKRGFVKRMKDIVLDTTYMNAFHLTEKEIVATLRRVEKKRNMVLCGYASSLYEIARVAQKFNLQNRFGLALSWGDKMFDHYRRVITQAFGCEVRENYGLSEGFMVGQQKDLPYYYVYTPSIHIEILEDNDQPVNDGSIGRIILTKLDGYAMPLIRFDTGDLGVMLPRDKYPSKRDFAFPLLERVIGRNTDIVTTADGKTLIVHTFTGIFEFYEEIEQFQVLQTSPNKLVIKYIPSVHFKEDVLERIVCDFRKRTMSNIEIQWEKVRAISPSASGKPQILLNLRGTKSLADHNA